MPQIRELRIKIAQADVSAPGQYDGRRLPIANNNLTGMNPVTGQPYINPTAK